MKIYAASAFLLAATAVAQIPGKGYSVLFAEDFPGDHVDTTRWTYRTDAKALSTQLPRNVAVQGGTLNITPRKEPVAGLQFTGGGIVSVAAFRYGYFQVEAKVTADPGWHTSFWMMAGDGKTTFPDRARTELDDFEIESPWTVSMGYLTWNMRQQLSSKRCDNTFKPGFSTTEAMHTYGLEWTEEGLTYHIDGKPVCRQPFGSTMGTHDRLNIWLTTIGARTPISASGTSPAQYRAVRYFIRDYYVDAGDPEFAEYGKDWHDGPEPGFSNATTRTSCSADATAVYTPSILEGGTYNVQVWQVKNSPSAKSGEIEAELHTQAGLETRLIPANGATGWFELGSFSFAKGVTDTITLRAKNGCVQANAVKLLRR